VSLSERRTLGRLTRSIRGRRPQFCDYLARLDASDAEDGATASGARTKNLAEKIEALRKKRGRCEAMLAQLDRIGEDQISLTDPDSRAMGAAHTRVAVGYNAQVAVEAKNKMIIEQAVTNQVVDMGLLTQTAEPARDILGVDTIDLVADRGYFKNEDIEACEKAGCIPHVPKPQRGSSVRERFFRKDEFSFRSPSPSSSSLDRIRSRRRLRIAFRPKVVVASRRVVTYYDENGTGSSPGDD